MSINCPLIDVKGTTPDQMSKFINDMLYLVVPPPSHDKKNG